MHEAQILEPVRTEYIEAQMNDGLEQVRLIIGDVDVSELSDNSIKDALWEYYFDVEKTIQWSLGSWYLNIKARSLTPVLEERERRNLAKERKGEPVLLDLFPLPFFSVPTCTRRFR